MDTEEIDKTEAVIFRVLSDTSNLHPSWILLKQILRTRPSVSFIPVRSLLSQWRRCSASFCIRVFTEDPAVDSNLELSPLLTLGTGAGVASEALTGAGAWGCAWGAGGLGGQGFAEADSTGFSFSKLETSTTSVVSEQRFFDGDGFVQDFSRLKKGHPPPKFQISIISHNLKNHQ